MMYGSTLVTTARLTSALNCSLRFGDMVDSAMSDCTTPRTIMPTIGAPRRLTLPNSPGNIRSCAEARAISASVNCQPSREPTQAMAASPMTMEPTIGLNI
jgi:hypothetical protein